MRIFLYNIAPNNPELIGVILDILVAVGTIGLAVATFYSLRENKLARYASMQPNIIVDFDIDNSMYLQWQSCV